MFSRKISRKKSLCNLGKKGFDWADLVFESIPQAYQANVFDAKDSRVASAVVALPSNQEPGQDDVAAGLNLRGAQAAVSITLDS